MSTNENATKHVQEEYEPCEECLFDHSYEPEEANEAHHLLMRKSYCDGCGEVVIGDGACDCVLWNYEDE